MSQPPLRFLSLPDGSRLAYRLRTAPLPRTGLVWLGGFASDMSGAKASALEAWARRSRRAFLRFDYFGHGESSGRLEDGTIGRWKADALNMLDRLTKGPQILVGSSMGAWLALLAARERPSRVKGLLLLAPAPDFTEDLFYARLSPQKKRLLRRKGRLETREGPLFWPLIREARNHLLLKKPFALKCPVHILHGAQDAVVPRAHALRLIERLAAPEIRCTIIEGGDHRLSEPDDLQRLRRAAQSLLSQIESSKDRKPSR